MILSISEEFTVFQCQDPWHNGEVLNRTFKAETEFETTFAPFDGLGIGVEEDGLHFYISSLVWFPSKNKMTALSNGINSYPDFILLLFARYYTKEVKLVKLQEYLKRNSYESCLERFIKTGLAWTLTPISEFDVYPTGEWMGYIDKYADLDEDLEKKIKTHGISCKEYPKISEPTKKKSFWNIFK